MYISVNVNDKYVPSKINFLFYIMKHFGHKRKISLNFLKKYSNFRNNYFKLHLRFQIKRLHRDRFDRFHKCWYMQYIN